MTLTINTNCLYNGYFLSSGSVNGSIWRAYAPLAAGTYEMRMLGVGATSRGKTDLLINGVSAGNYDWYRSSTVFNLLWSLSVSIPSSKNHLIEIQINGKHASSTNYSLGFMQMSFSRTGQT
jgi:hypothetical protein